MQLEGLSRDWSAVLETSGSAHVMFFAGVVVIFYFSFGSSFLSYNQFSCVRTRDKRGMNSQNLNI